MLRAVLNKSWRQHPTRHQLYGHLPPITKTIQVRRTRHAGHRWRSKDELISDVLLWTPTYGCAKAGRLARTYIQQLCEDTGCNPEDLPEAMNDREKWRERVRDIRAGGTTWWWWWYIVSFWDTNRSPNPDQKTRPSNNEQKKQKNKKKNRVDFDISVDHRVKIKENEKCDKYLDLAWEIRNLWNMKVTVMPIVIGTLGTNSKNLVRGLLESEIEGRAETIQTTALLRSARILRRVLETWGDLLSLRFLWKTIS